MKRLSTWIHRIKLEYDAVRKLAVSRGMITSIIVNLEGFSGSVIHRPTARYPSLQRVMGARHIIDASPLQPLNVSHVSRNRCSTPAPILLIKWPDTRLRASMQSSSSSDLRRSYYPQCHLQTQKDARLVHLPSSISQKHVVPDLPVI